MLESSTGMSDKNAFIRAIETGKLIHSQMKKEVQRVKLLANCAVVISKGRNIGHYVGVAFDAEQWVTNIFVKDAEKWICTMTQEMPVTCQSGT